MTLSFPPPAVARLLCGLRYFRFSESASCVLPVVAGTRDQGVFDNARGDKCEDNEMPVVLCRATRLVEAEGMKAEPKDEDVLFAQSINEKSNPFRPCRRTVT